MDHIKAGDMVSVYLGKGQPAFLQGKVLKRPNGSGKAWVIEDEFEQFYFVRCYHRIVKAQ